MNKITEFLTCKYNNCNKYYENPIKLPCENTICKEHIDKLMKENNEFTFTCLLCNRQHNLISNDIKLNQDILNVLNMNLHLKPKQLLAKDSLEKFKHLVDEMITTANNPLDEVYKQVGKVRNEITEKRDEVKKQVDEISSEMLRKLDDYENECKQNQQISSAKSLKKFKNKIEILNSDLANVNDQLRFPTQNDDILDDLITQIETLVVDNRNQMNELKSVMQNKKEIAFESGPKFESTLFGKLEIRINIYDKCLTYITNAHNHIIDCIEVLNQNIIVSCSRDKRIKFWNLNDKVCIKTIEAHKDEVNCLKLISDSILASGSADSTIKIFDLNSYECIQTLSGHLHQVSCLALNSNGELISGSFDRSIKVWNLTNLNCTKTLYGHTNHVNCLLVSQKGHLVSGAADHTIKLWAFDINQCFRTLEGHTDSVSCLELYSNDFLISGSFDKTIKIWSLENASCLTTIENDSRIRCIKLLNNLLISGNSVNLKIWQLGEPNSITLVKLIEGHADTIFDIKILQNGNLVSASGDGSINQWES